MSHRVPALRLASAQIDDVTESLRVGVELLDVVDAAECWGLGSSDVTGTCNGDLGKVSLGVTMVSWVDG